MSRVPKEVLTTKSTISPSTPTEVLDTNREELEPVTFRSDTIFAVV
jgi:hypothetical protein